MKKENKNKVRKYEDKEREKEKKEKTVGQMKEQKRNVWMIERK